MPSRAPSLRNRYYTAAFTPGGGLSQMRDCDNERPLIVSSNISYRFKGQTFSDVAGDSRCTARDIHFDDTCVRSVLVSPHLKVTRRFTCEPDHPLLKVDLTIEPGEQPATLTDVRLPRLDFADDFASVIEGDEHDLYFDGAELGDGRQLPCWRVFFCNGHQRGLLIAARSKAMMSHIQIWPHAEPCVECRPHLMCSYSSDYTQFDAPLTLAGGECLSMAFECGPWWKRDHDRLLQSASLMDPVQASGPVRRRRRAKQLEGVVFAAADIAPSRAIGDGCQQDRWMATREASTHFAPALFANSGYRPPMLDLDPELTGRHRIFLGVGTASRACLHLSGEKHPRYRHVPANIANMQPWPLQLTNKGKPAEIDFGIADMTGQRVRFGMPYTTQGHGMLDYIRFQPLSPSQISREKIRAKSNPVLQLTGFADTYDIGYMWGDAASPTTAPYRAVIAAHKRAGFERIFWRIDGECSDFPTAHGTMRPISCFAHNAYEPGAKAYSLMLQRNDLLRAAVNEGQHQGVAIWGWMRFNSYFPGARSKFFIDHPEYRDHGEGGSVYDFRLSLAKPQVRRHKIDILVEAASYGLPGLCLGFLRHPPIVCYPPSLVDSYRKTYGCEPPRDLTPDCFQHLQTLPEATPQHLQWYRHRAEVMTAFGRELKDALRAAKREHTRIAIWVRPNHCLFDGIDLDMWLREGLCDEVIAGPYAGKVKLLAAKAAWRRHVQKHVPLIGGIMPIEPRGQWSKRRVHAQVQRFVREGYDGLCTYESNDAVNNQEMIDLYLSLHR